MGNYQGFQKNCASDLRASSSCPNNAMITSHLQNIEKSNFHTHLYKKVQFGLFFLSGDIKLTQTSIKTHENQSTRELKTSVILRIFFVQLDFTPNVYRYQNSAKQNIARGGYRTSPTSKMEFFVIIVYSFKPLTIFTENPQKLSGSCIRL